MATQGFKTATRLMRNVLAGPERRVLVWIAGRLPAQVTSDHLTALALVSMVMAGASYAAAGWHRGALASAVFWLAVNWFGDSLDGTVARVRKQERPRYGFYVDHAIDCLGAVALLAGLA